MAGNTILIVEDEPNIAEVVELYLRRAGYQVRKAQDGLKGHGVPGREHPRFIDPGSDAAKVLMDCRSHAGCGRGAMCRLLS